MDERDYLDVPAYPMGMGEATTEDNKRPVVVELWGNAKTGLMEPMIVAFDQNGKFYERGWQRPPAGTTPPSPPPPAPPASAGTPLPVVAAILFIATALLWVVWLWLI